VKPSDRGDKPLLSLIILNYNGRELLDECISSVMNQSIKNYEVIVVDNDSDDDSVSFIKENYPDIRLIINHENLGFSGGNNVGIKLSRGKYIVVLNNDTVVDYYFLEKLVEVTETYTDVGMLAPKILNYYSRNIIDSAGLVLYPDGIARGRGRLEKDVGQFDRIEEVFFPSGCAALYRRDMLNTIGLFDDDFFMYLEDVDLGLRARLAGWRCLFVPDAVVYHKYSSTTKSYSPMKAFLVERNRIWVLLKNFPSRQIMVSPFYSVKRYIFLLYGILSGKGLAKAFKKESTSVRGLLILTKAYLSALRGSGKMIKKRKQIKMMKRVKDSDFFKWLKLFSADVRDVTLKE